MDLHQKLARLADKQRVIEAQIAEQSAEENHAVARVLAALIERQPQAVEALRHPKLLSFLSKRDAHLPIRCSDTRWTGSRARWSMAGVCIGKQAFRAVRGGQLYFFRSQHSKVPMEMTDVSLGTCLGTAKREIG